MSYRVHYVDRQADFDRVIEEISIHQWIGFDTEFVGEKTYIPVLCLLQIVVENNIYLVDILRIHDISRFLKLLENPEILIITHAGDNDYRLLNTLYGTIPNNTFDTQIAAGFVGYNYPAGFSKIVEKELRISLAKSHTVTDWEKRPLSEKALDYAVEDVKFLPELHHILDKKLQKLKRQNWAREENRKWENPEFYRTDPDKELLSNDHVFQLDFREKVFLKRLYRWRIERAISLNLPRETVLQGKHFGSIVRGIKDGANGMRANRTLNEGVWRKFIEEWTALWKNKATPEEIAFFESLPKPPPENPEREWTMELLYHFIKKRCLEHEISAALLFPKGDFNRLKSGSEDFDHSLLEGWRAELMGPELTSWLKKGKKLTMQWANGACTLHM
jgi:ribonuclease D